MSAPAAGRGVVLVNGRAVHYRRGGRGPAVVALHGSPESATALEPLIAALGDRFTVIALDTPGNGDSDPLEPPQPQSADYAHALLDTLDALGLGRVHLYGFHTGAGTAIETALTAPDRVAALALDGYGIWTEAERAVFLGPEYLAPFEPSWDGAQLAHLWSRIEEQSVFFPFHERTEAARIDMDVPALDKLHRRCLDWLKAGDAYRGPYAAAFRRRGGDSLARVAVPTLLGASPPDPLVAHLDRVSGPSAHVTVTPWPDRNTGFAAIGDFFARHGADPAPGTLGAGDGPDGLGRGFASGLHWRGRRAGAGRPLVLLHDAGGSSRLFAPALARIARARPVLALDLPGHGLSDEVAAPGDWADAVAAWMADMGLADAAVAGFHVGGIVATSLKASGRAHAAGLIGAPVFTPDEAGDRLARYAPSLAPSWEGAHLLRAWRMLRRQAMFYPWYAPTRAARVAQLGALDPHVLQRRLVDLLRAGPAYQAAYAAQHGSALGPVVAQAGAVTLFQLAWDPLGAPLYAHRLAEHGRVEVAILMDAPAAWGETLAGWAG